MVYGKKKRVDIICIRAYAQKCRIEKDVLSC